MYRPRLRTVLTACVVAAGVTTLAAPAAFALPISENTIKSECRSAGGAYSTHKYEGIRFSQCTYTDIHGDRYTDLYMDGEYDSTI